MESNKCKGCSDCYKDTDGVWKCAKERFDGCIGGVVIKGDFTLVNELLGIKQKKSIPYEDLFDYLDDKWKYYAMDKDKRIYAWEEKPEKSIDKTEWVAGKGYTRIGVRVDTTGIKWKKSLRSRD